MNNELSIFILPFSLCPVYSTFTLIVPKNIESIFGTLVTMAIQYSLSNPIPGDPVYLLIRLLIPPQPSLFYTQRALCPFTLTSLGHRPEALSQ